MSRAYVKHGCAADGRATPEYLVWCTMKQRCVNPRSAMYRLYGGRGIRVCERWQTSFANFLADVGPRPGSSYSLDRIDNDGPYSPSNCRWATKVEQNRNSRSNRMLTHGGLTLALCEWAERVGIKPKTIAMRLRLGWSVERALSAPLVPLDGARSHSRMIEFGGRVMHLKAWAVEVGIKPDTIADRLDRGWSVDRALTEPAARSKRNGSVTRSVA